MKTLGERIRTARAFRKKTQQQVADAVGMSQQTLQKIEAGKVERTSYMLKLARALGVDPSWLEFGTGDMLGNEAQGKRYDQVPLISWVQAGDWHEAVDPYAVGDAEAWLSCPVSHGPHAFALRVRGASMEPDYHDGDLIFIDPASQPENKDDIVVRDVDGNVTFKRLVIEGDQRFLLAANPAWPDRIIPFNSHTIVAGTVIFSGRMR